LALDEGEVVLDIIHRTLDEPIAQLLRECQELLESQADDGCAFANVRCRDLT
jgi:hypothetical protein